MSGLSTLKRVFSQHRPGLARLVALGGVLAVGTVLAPRVPREVKVELVLGPTHHDFTEVRIAYLQEGEELHGVAFTFPAGAPERVRHTVSLPAGDFEVRAELRRPNGGSQASVGHLHAPAAGTVRIPLAERTP
ncbi:MAG TPA: hypothetical protein VF331_28065 [Polyangiales bacterium]